MTPIKEIIEKEAANYSNEVYEEDCSVSKDWVKSKRIEIGIGFEAGAEWAITDMAECMEWAYKEGWIMTVPLDKWWWENTNGAGKYEIKNTTELITIFFNQKYKTNG